MPLKVVIVGAGLAGLGAAIALTRAGHDVEVVERSGFSNEVGAAIHVAPNATRILQAWGCNIDSLEPVSCEQLSVWSKDVKHIMTPVVTKDLQKLLAIEDEWLLTHRVDLHTTLRETATRKFNGKKANIRLSSAAVSVNAEAGEVTLEDGTKVTGGLIVGADGIHSRSVTAVTGSEPEEESTGQNCFRFLVPISKMLANPITADLVEKIKLNGLHAFATPDRRLVIYPCRRGNLLNVVAIHPSVETDAGSEHSSYLNAGSLDQLLQTYATFSPELQEMCKMAEDLKLWALASRQPPRAFHRGRIALVGDAAHPMLPHQGQGAAQAFEDGAALGTLFPADTAIEDVPNRLQLYSKVRYERGLTVMFMSKTNDERRAEMATELRRYVPNAEVPENMFTYTWPSDPVREAEELLRSI